LFAVGVGLTTGKVKKVVEQEVSGVQVKCVESRWGEIQQSLCFDAVTGALLLRRERSGSYESYYEYADYQKVGEKRYPRSLRYYQNGHKEIEAEVSELSTELSADPGIFELPGAKEWPACDKVEPPKALSMPDPSFPSGVKTNNAMSVLILLVTKDGRPERLRVAHSGGAAFDDAAMQAVRRWTFQPALCNGTMIPVQITVEVDFRR
jgi:TonB family protein